MAPEQLLVFLLIAAVWLAGAIAQWLKARREQQSRPRAETEPREPVRELEERLPPRVRTIPAEVSRRPRAALAVPAERPPSAVAAAAPVRPLPARRRARVSLGGAADLRRAVVLMTVLGPCRALERDARR